ncbi:unnamed protein product [Clavelina lepadiformis]|uniref:GRAM domain-containing protein n=1 Tax=Clavelina lepadiformis TaxID=159417 RepID=A0ABP0FV70_CLALP
MSLNKNVAGGIALFQGEMILRESDGVEATFKKFTHSCEHLKGSKRGHVYLTNFRLIFISEKKSDMLRELSMPFKNIKDFEIKQPVFGANYLQGKVIAENQGGWEGSAVFEMVFKDGGAIEIGEKLVDLATKPPKMMYPAPSVLVCPAVSIQGYAVAGSSNAYAFPAPSAPPLYQPQPNPPAYPQQTFYNPNVNSATSKVH